MVQPGYYSVRVGSFTSATEASFTATGEVSCEAGFYCSNGTGVRRPCGSWGEATDAATGTTGMSDTPNQFVCKAGAVEPQVVSEGWYSLGGDNTTRRDLAICPVGHWCSKGSRNACPKGSYGKEPGLRTIECSGKCKQGYQCPPGSTSGNDANSKCLGGYYCSGSTSSTTEFACGGPSKYCPPGSEVAQDVQDFYYSSPIEDSALLRSAERECENGYKCVGGVRSDCSDTNSGDAALNYCVGGQVSTALTGYYTVGNVIGRAYEQAECVAGEYCQKGVSSPCPKGHYGKDSRLVLETCSGTCTEGFYGDRTGLTMSTCAGPCFPGKTKS